MNKGFKILAVAALVAASTVVGQGLYANCQDNGQYEVRQCARGSWFAAPPPTAGTTNIAWWALGFGNRTVSGAAGANVSPEGSGILPTPLPGVFVGIDSGLAGVVELDLVDATTIPGLGAPPGTTCLSSAANWGAPGIDSCIDINRNYTSGGGTASVSDNYVNRYFNSTYGPIQGYMTLENQLDPAMAVLLTESTGRFYALAFFASAPKLAPKETDLDTGQYHMQLLVNGDTNSFGPVVVPWQPVPQPDVVASLSVPSDPLSPRNLQFSWTTPRFVHDNSTRPCRLFDGTTPCASVSGGVGVMDQGPLIRHNVESSPIDAAGNCGTTWTPVAGSSVNAPGTSVAVNGIAPDTCVRLVTAFGKVPAATMGGTLATNRTNSQVGRLGDIGYNVISTPIKVGGTLVSQKATLKFANREKGDLRVSFDTDTELNVTSFDVVGIDGKGGRKVIGSVACKQCTTGLSASYDELIAGAKLQGAKQVQVVMQPSGVQSNTLDLK